MELLHQKYPTDYLLKVLPIIEEHVPATKGNQLRFELEAIVNDANPAKSGKLTKLVDYIAANKPERFGEYVAYVTLSMAFDMTKFVVTSDTVDLKNRLVQHVFEASDIDYSDDFRKVSPSFVLY